MRLRTLELSGFGCLRHFQAEPAPGFNVFYGLNEAGKSTLQQAICALLYGFYDGDRARPDESARHERFRPWPGQSGVAATVFRGSLQYELEDGRLYEVRRDFSTADVATQLIDLTTGNDIASQFGGGRHGNIPFARRQLGMSRAVFQSSAFISQGEVFQVVNGASPREIGDAIAALADSAHRDVSASAAISRLGALLQKIGGDRARTAELPVVRDNLRRARAELEALDSARRSVSAKAGELEARQARLGLLRQELRRTDASYLRARIALLERRLIDLRTTEEALARGQAAMQELQGYASFPAHLRDALVGLREQRGKALEVIARCESELGEGCPAISKSEKTEYEALRASVGGLSADEIDELQSAAYSATSGEPAVPPGIFRRLLGGAVRVIISILRRLLLWFGGPEPAVVEPRRSSKEAREILERHRRYLTLRPEVERVGQAETRLQQERLVLSAIEGKLSGVLAAAGMGRGDIKSAVAEFLESCQRQRRYEVACAATEEARRRQEILLRDGAPDQVERQLGEASERLEERLAAEPQLATMECDEPVDELARTLARLQEEQRGQEIAVARLEQEVRSAMLDHKPRAGIEEEIERWRRQVTRLEQARRAAEMAQEAIGEAMVSVYRDFAPAVNSFLSDGFQYITDGRYRRAHVDPATMRVSLLLPETEQVIADPPVSRGTLALAYFLMRIGLARHMSSIGEPVPLLLDDPFVDIDERRLPRLLAFLTRLSEVNQVLLFTKDANILDWCERHIRNPDNLVHHLSTASLAAAPL